jgi:iron complex transport system ATP-binding protein
MNLLRTEALAVSVAGHTVVSDLSLSVARGQCWAILGRNGAGKTTLLHTLAGLRDADGGRLDLDGGPMTALSRRTIARRLALMPQDSSDPFPATVLETALIGRHPHLGVWEWEGPEDRERARQALAAVGLGELSDRDVTTLSGGERRRLAVATVLTQEPQIYLLDEPVNHLDPHHQVRLLQLLRTTADNGAVMMSLHDVNLAARFCDRVLLLYGNGESEHGPTAELLTAERLERLYGHPVRVFRDGNARAFLPA